MFTTKAPAVTTNFAASKSASRPFLTDLRIGSCLACVYRVTDARGEHERSLRVARGVVESNSSFLSALQTSQVHPELDIRTAKSINQFFYNIVSIN